MFVAEHQRRRAPCRNSRPIRNARVSPAFVPCDRQLPQVIPRLASIAPQLRSLACTRFLPASESRRSVVSRMPHQASPRPSSFSRYPSFVDQPGAACLASRLGGPEVYRADIARRPRPVTNSQRVRHSGRSRFLRVYFLSAARSNAVLSAVLSHCPLPLRHWSCTKSTFCIMSSHVFSNRFLLNAPS